MITGTPILDIKPYHHLESVDVFGKILNMPNGFIIHVKLRNVKLKLKIKLLEILKIF
jgi:hypothetical protein